MECDDAQLQLEKGVTLRHVATCEVCQAYQRAMALPAVSVDAIAVELRGVRRASLRQMRIIVGISVIVAGLAAAVGFARGQWGLLATSTSTLLACPFVWRYAQRRYAFAEGDFFARYRAEIAEQLLGARLLLGLLPVVAAVALWLGVRRGDAVLLADAAGAALLAVVVATKLPALTRERDALR